MYLLVLWMAELRGMFDELWWRELVLVLKRILYDIGMLLECCEDMVMRVVECHFDKDFFFYFGWYIGLVVCFEGAFKLKEIFYIVIDVYVVGEMKHGLIVLFDE